MSVMTQEEGAIIDRLARGEAVEHTSSCAGCNHAHVHHRHKTRLRPCELCECTDLISRRRPRRSDDSQQAVRLRG